MPERDVLDAALAYLRRRERSRAEISVRLNQLGYDPEQIESALERLDRYGYLDEHGMAQRIATRRRSQLFGEAAIHAELDSKLIESKPEPEGELPRAHALLRRRFPDADPTLLPRAARLLASRGFTEETITQAISAYFPDSAPFGWPD